MKQKNLDKDQKKVFENGVAESTCMVKELTEEEEKELEHQIKCQRKAVLPELPE